jgi:hypothetical protein
VSSHTEAAGLIASTSKITITSTIAAGSWILCVLWLDKLAVRHSSAVRCSISVSQLSACHRFTVGFWIPRIRDSSPHPPLAHARRYEKRTIAEVEACRGKVKQICWRKCCGEATTESLAAHQPIS